jgi:uncharacterized protein YidB (DUF937 family)
MGLMDVLNGMMNGPRGLGTSTPSSTSGSSGMSPITMGLLALLAYKAMKGGGIFGGSNPIQPYTPAGSTPSPNQASGTDWLGGLGSLISGGAGGSILTGGLGELVKKFQQAGQGHVAQSWVGTGPNGSINPSDLEKAVGADTLDALSRQTGMPRDQLLAELAEHLPQTIDTLTPQGRIPTDHEAARWM